MNWYYIDGPHRVGPLSEGAWTELVLTGKITSETLVWHEGLANWTAFCKLPQASPVLLPEGGAPEEVPTAAIEEGGETPEAWADRVSKRDYPVNLRLCLQRAVVLLQQHFWMVVGSTFLIIAISIAGSCIKGLDLLVPLALQGVFAAGLYNVYLRLMRDEPVMTTDLFAGFAADFFRHLTLQTFVSCLASIVCFAPFYTMLWRSGISLQNIEARLISDPNGVMRVVLAALVCSIPAVFFAFIWTFSLPLIIDKRLSFWRAMELSRKKVLQHPWKVGVFLVGAGIAGSGGLLFSMPLLFITGNPLVAMSGLIFTLPIYIGATLYLYEAMFGEPPVEEGDAP